MTTKSVKRKLVTTVSCPASSTINTLTPKELFWDVIYLIPGLQGYCFSATVMYTNSQPECSTYECTYTFKDSQGNIMNMPKYIGPCSLNTSYIP